MSEELRRKHAVFAFVIFIILFSFLLITLAFYLPTKKSGRSKPENIRPPEKRATEKISSSSLKSAVWYSQPSDIPIEAAVDIYIGVDVLLRIRGEFGNPTGQVAQSRAFRRRQNSGFRCAADVQHVSGCCRGCQFPHGVPFPAPRRGVWSPAER